MTNGLIISIRRPKMRFSAKIYYLSSKTLRKAVWLNTNKSDLRGICYCCENFIEFDNFVCGHIIPVSIGGETNISNMKAICSPCNLNMGIMNLDKYKKLLSDQLDQSN